MLGGEQEGMGWSDEEAGFEWRGCSLGEGRGESVGDWEVEVVGGWETDGRAGRT